MPTPQFRTGIEESEKASARTQFIRTGYMKIEEDQSVSCRPLTDYDRMITVLQHNNAPTRAKPENHEGKWPQVMPAVCRADKAFRDMYSDCFLDIEYERTGDKRAYKPSSRSWGLAVIRKKVMEDGKFVGFADETVEITDADKKKIIIPKIVTVNYSYVNFWSNWSAFKEMYGTWLDRDVFVKRTGKELDSDYPAAQYEPVGIDSMRITEPGAEVLDMRKMEHAKKYIEALGLDPSKFENPGDAFFSALMILVAERASDEFYARFFDTRVAQPASSVVPTDAHEKPVDSGPSEDALAEMAARVSGHTDQQPATIGFG